MTAGEREHKKNSNINLWKGNYAKVRHQIPWENGYEEQSHKGLELQRFLVGL